MKKTMSLLLLLNFAFAALAGFPQAFAEVQTKPINKTPLIIAEAERAWNPFFENFREIVKKRDRQGLYETMAKDFYFSCAYNGGFGYQGAGIGRDFEIKKFDAASDPAYDCHGWENFASIITARKVTGILKKGELIGGLGEVKRTPSRVVSEYGNNGGKRICSPDGGGDWALFEYRQGRWYLVTLSFCETE